MEETTYPNLHIGIIADGNRRWAREHNLPTLEGHKKGLDVVGDLVDAALEHAEIKFLSFFVFSTENWGRSKEEVGYLMNLAMSRILNYAKKMKDKNVRMLILGVRDRLDQKLSAAIDEAEEMTKNCTGLTVCFCFNYGGKQEIADAASKIISERLSALKSKIELNLSKGEDPESDVDTLDITKVTPEDIEDHLYKPEVPACDLIIRTSGEERISGFMLWRSAYSEFLFEPKKFPELTAEDLTNFLENYYHRQRRFGK